MLYRPYMCFLAPPLVFGRMVTAYLVPKRFEASTLTLTLPTTGTVAQAEEHAGLSAMAEWRLRTCKACGICI